MKTKLFIKDIIGRLHFCNPPRNNILVFDNEGSYILKKTILYDMEYTVLQSRKERYYVTLTLACLFVKNLKHIKLVYLTQYPPIKRIRKLLGQLILQLYGIYLLCCVEYISPKIVITWIDNHCLFHWISRTYNKAEFYAIQNGVRAESNVKHRLPKPPELGSIISMPNFICFGDYEKDLYTANGHMIDNFYPVGSLLAGWYKAQNINSKCEKIYDLCLISQWHAKPEGEDPQVNVCLTRLNEFIARFLKDNPMPFYVATRSEDSREIEYFKSTFRDKVKIIEQEKDGFSTYRAMDRSKVIISFGSTAAREAFGWGEKVLFCNFSGLSACDFPREGFWELNEYDYEKFKKCLNDIISMDKKDYALAAKEAADYVMKSDINNPPHVYIRQVLLKKLIKRGKYENRNQGN